MPLIQSENLEASVLERVTAVYRFRQLARPTIIKGAGLGGLLTLTWFQVSFLDVLMNSPSPARPGDFYLFMADAFQKTESLVKLLAFLLLVVISWLMKDLVVNFQFSRLWPNFRSSRYLHFFRF